MRIAQVVIDSLDPPALARFYGELTGRTVSEEGAVYTSVDDPAMRDVILLIQRVYEPPTQSKNRVHIDLFAPDPDREAERAVGLGARVLSTVQEGEGYWVVLSDPQGNEFCIIRSESD